MSSLSESSIQFLQELSKKGRISNLINDFLASPSANISSLAEIFLDISLSEEENATAEVHQICNCAEELGLWNDFYKQVTQTYASKIDEVSFEEVEKISSFLPSVSNEEFLRDIVKIFRSQSIGSRSIGSVSDSDTEIGLSAEEDFVHKVASFISQIGGSGQDNGEIIEDIKKSAKNVEVAENSEIISQINLENPNKDKLKEYIDTYIDRNIGSKDEKVRCFNAVLRASNATPSTITEVRDQEKAGTKSAVIGRI